MTNIQHIIPRDSFTFMTNGNCALADVTEKQLNDAGLSYQKASDMGVKDIYGETFFPLTKKEESLIAPDMVGFPHRGLFFSTSHTALYNGKKYFALVCEMIYESETEQSAVKKISNFLLKPLSCIALITDGLIYQDTNGEPEESWSDGTGYYTIILFIPFAFALEREDNFYEWHSYLTGVFDGTFGSVGIFKPKQ